MTLKLRFYLHPFFTANVIALCMLFVGSPRMVNGQGLMVSLVPVDADKMVINPPENINGWNSDLYLVDTSWTLCAGAPGGVGFDESREYDKYISLDVAQALQSRGSTYYIRTKFNLASSILKELDYLAIGIRYDDGFIAYLNGELVASANAPLNPNYRSSASQPHEAQSMLWFDISQHVDNLQAGENLFAIHGMNITADSPDFLIQAELVARKNYQRNFVSDLPIVTISTDGNLAINGNTLRNAAMGIISNGTGNDHRVTDAPNDFSGRIVVTQLVNSYNYPKNHYDLTLKDDLGATTSASLLGLPAGDEWILYAPYNDKTLVRNVFMGEIAANVGRGHAPQMCHVFINDDYFGLYALQEKINRHENRINISEPGMDGDALTGGYILEIDDDRSAAGFNSPIAPFYRAPYPIRYLYNYPAGDDMTEQQKDYIHTFINSFEADVINVIDLNSAVDYFLLNELAKNVDAYRNHSILYKDRDSVNPKLLLKSTLDYNNACGNTSSYEGNRVQGWELSFTSQPGNVASDSMFVPLWWQQLVEDSLFQRQLYKRWTVLHQNVLSEEFVLEKIDSLYNLLKNDSILNFERWPVTGKPIEPYGYVGKTYDDDYDHFYVWMADRLDWIKQAMQEFATSVEVENQNLNSFQLTQNYPNPFNSQTTILYTVPQSSHVRLRIYNIRGALVEELVNKSQAAGQYTISWKADAYPSGLYIYELSTNSVTQRQRMLLVR